MQRNYITLAWQTQAEHIEDLRGRLEGAGQDVLSARCQLKEPQASHAQSCMHTDRKYT